MKKLSRLIWGFMALQLCLLSGCSYLGASNPFVNDPLTGGVDTAHSSLLGFAIPAGWQVYPSHGYTATTAGGQQEGLETYRSSISLQAATSSFFNALTRHGWQLRLHLQKSDRIVCLYRKSSLYALLCFRRQGMLTILEIWSGPELPDGAGLFTDVNTDILPSIEGEEYGPRDGTVTEQWGGTLQEREL